MNFHGSAQPFFRSRANSYCFQQLHEQKVFSLASDRKLWLAVGKILLVIGPILLAGNLWLAASCNTLRQSVRVAENVQYQLKDSQIKLKAKRDLLFSRERVRILAAEQLSLHVPEKEQVQFF